MTFLQIMAFLLMAAGILVLLRVSPADIGEEAAKALTKPKTLHQRVKESREDKRRKGLSLLVFEAKLALKATGRENRFAGLVMLSLCGILFGAVMGLSLKNVFLTPVLMGGFALLPFIYVLLTLPRYQKDLARSLEITLSAITTSYLRSNDLIEAVRENIYNIEPPLREVFTGFLNRAAVSTDLKGNLRELRDQVDHVIYREWIDTLLICVDDHKQAPTLLPIVNKFGELRFVSGELENMLYQPLKEYIIMAILLLGNIPLLYFLNKDWYGMLMHSIPGQILLALYGVVLFISLLAVVRLCRPPKLER